MTHRCHVKGCPHRLRGPWWASGLPWRCPAHNRIHRHDEAVAAAIRRRRPKPPRIAGLDRVRARMEAAA